MKRKLFFITFLMLLCSTIFGQITPKYNYVEDGTYQHSMTLSAVIEFDGVEQNNPNLELGVFCGDELRGGAVVEKIAGRYYARPVIYGQSGQFFTFKVYDHTTEIEREWSVGSTFTYGGSTMEYMSYNSYGYGNFSQPAVIDFVTPNHWIPNHNVYENNYDVIAVVLIDDIEQAGQDAVNLELGAFSVTDGTVRGSVKLNSQTILGNTRYYADMLVYGNENDKITFRLYNHATEQELQFNDVNTCTLIEDNDATGNPILGSYIKPVEVNFITEPYVAQIGDKNYTSLEKAIAAAQAGDVVKVFAGTYPLPSMKAGITIEGAVDENGEVKVLFEGTLTGTLEDLTLKNIHIKGENAQRWAYAKGDLTFVNVIFEATSVYALHFDGITEGTNLLYEDCTIIGWAAMGGTPESCTFIGCTIKDNRTYGVIRTYFDTTIEECIFDVAHANPDDNFQDGIHAVYGAYVNVNGCTNVNGSMKDIVNIHAMSVVSIDGVEIKHLAKIGDNYYFTLAEAFAAVQNGETVKLLTDLTLDSETYTIADGKSVTLDMNGKKITVTDNKTSNYELFYIYGGLTVIGDGTIELTATNDRDWNAMSAIFHNRGGVLTINNGTFKHLGGTDMAYVVDNSGNHYGDATTNINNGTLASTYIAIRNRMEQNTHGASGKAILNVYGGTINGERRAIWAQAASTSETAPATGEINISGGNIGLIETDRSTGAVSMTTISGGTVTEFKGEVNELKVTGGTLNDVTIMDASGNEIDYAVNKYGLYVAAVAKIGDKGYVSIQAAVNEAQDGNTVIVKEGKYNVFCPIGSDDNYTGSAHNLFVGKSITIKGEEGKKVVIYSYQETYTSTFDARITLLISGSDGVVIDNLTILPCYYPATITTDLSTVTGSEINALVGADNLKYYYNQIIDAMRSYNGSGQVSENYIANITVKNCTIGDEAIPAENWGSAIYYPGAVGNATNFAGLTGGYTIENNVLFGGICICEGAAKDAATGTCIIKNNTIHGGLFLNGKRPTGWNYVSLTKFPTVTGNTFTQTAGNTDGHAWFIGSRDGDEAAVIPTETLEAYLANNTFTVASDKKAKVVVGSYAYSAEATEYYGLVSSEFIVDGEGTENNPYIITDLHELEAFRDAVNAGNNFSGKVFKLDSNIDLNPTRAINYWEPIGTQANPFEGTFDGGNNTISNLVVEGENYLGLFGKTDGATIKNVKINNVTINGVSYLGAIVGMGYTGTIDNCHVTGYVEIAGNYMVGGINGQGYATVNNSSVVANDNSFVKAIHDDNNNEGDNVGGIVGHCGETNTLTANTVKNITISGTRKVGGIVGIANHGTKVENCVVEDVTIETSATEAYANDNITTMSIGALIGQYQNNGSAGTVKDCMVTNVEFKNVNNVNVSVGPITGGSRGGTNGMLDPTGVTASNNNIYMSTITGSNNLYLMNAVAKIGETKYYTLQEAVDASETNETTIDVIANTAETINVQEGANITINNINLTGSILAPNATLKIVNGSIVNNNSNVSAIEINDGTLNLEGVNITSARHAVRIDGAVIATIDGGTYKSAIGEGTGTYHALNIGNKTSQVTANVTITAGTFVGPKGTTADSGAAVNVQLGSTVTIEGGDFSGGKNATLGVSGEMIVKGGRFDQDPSAYLADAYTVNIENEMYVVRYTPIMVTYPVGNPVYPEGKVEYYSDMLEAVPYTTNCPRLEGATITLLADVSGAGMRFMENDMVFDLNGHTYTITAGTGSQGTNTSGFQIRPEVTTNVLFKDGTIKVAEGAPVVWMFNCYATDFIVENVTVDCSNMAYSYGGSCYVVVSQEGDNVQLTGETKIVNFNSDVAGNAINVGDTMIIGEYVDLGGGTIELDGGAQLTARAGLTVVTVDGYMVVYENGVYKSVKVVAQVGENKFGSVIAALNHAIANNEAQVKIVSDSRELMPTDVELRLNANLEITAAQPYTVKFYNNGTSYDFVVGSYNSNTLTFGENVTFQLEDRIIWLGYYGNDVDVVVNGTLAASQIWHGADTEVTSTGTIKTTGEAFVMRRGATLTVNGGKVNANYFNILAGNILAENAEITCGAMWIANTGNYIYEGNVNINIKSSTLTSNGNLTSSTAHDDGVSINFENSEVTFVLFDGYGVSSIDANTVLNIKGENAEVSIVGLTNNGLVNVTEKAKPTLTGTVTNNGAMKLDATSVIYAPENLGVTIDDNDYDVVYENGAYQAVHKPFVAEVDGTQFTSLQGAFEAVQDNGTITLLRDVTFDLTTVGYQDENWVDGVRYNGDKSFTVNFNTYKVTDNGCVNDYLININNKGEKDNEITFTNGTIESANGCWATVCVGAESSTHKTVLNLNYMNIINENDASYSGNLAVRVRGTADVNTTVNVNTGTTITSDGASYGIAPSTNGAVVNINDGATIIQKNSGTSGGNSVFTAVGGKGTVNIYGGAIISSDRYGVHTMTTGTPVVNIYGGTITAQVALKASTNGGYGQSSTINVSDGMITGALEEYTDNAQIILTGGTFSTDVNAYCHENYDAIQGDDNLWRVEQVLFAQTTALHQGWNWFSSYVDLSQEGGLLKLQTALDESGLAIKGQTGNQSVQYGKIGVVNGEEIYAWTGNQNWNPYSNKMYMVRTSKPITVEIEGNLIDYENTTIALFKGWNWISYPLSEPAYANEALAGLTPTEGDQIKAYGANTYIEYSEGEWFPYNFVFMPGEGYMYKAESPNSFVYTKGTTNVRATNKTTENNNWIAQTSEYANNMTITAMLSIDGEVVNDNYEIAAFANGECRGSARPVYIEKFDAYILFMTVYGEEVEDLTFRYYDVNYGTEYELDNRVVYSNDASLGSIKDPYMFTLNITGVDETSMSEINIYPNPTTIGSEINLQATCDKVEVFNALGVKVAEYHNVDTLDAFETAGIYVIRITNDNAVKHCRLVVK